MIDQLAEAVLLIAGSITDPLARMIAAKPPAQWTAKQRAYLFNAIKKHAANIKAYGIEFGTIPDPAADDVSLPNSPYFIDLEGANLLTVAFPPSEKMDEDIKNIPKIRHRPKQGIYTLPARMIPVMRLQEFLAAGRRIKLFEFSPAARDLFESILRGAAERYELSRALDADIDMSGFGLELDPFQRAGAKSMLLFKRGWLADDMGLGKTRQILAAIYKANVFPAFIATPSSVPLQWAKEARKAMPDKVIFVAKNRKIPKHTCKQQLQATLFDQKRFDAKCSACCLYNADILIANYEKLWTPKKYDEAKELPEDELPEVETDLELSDVAKVINSLGIRFIGADESHYIKNEGALRTQACIKIATDNKCEYRIAISGTPVKNRPAELKPQAQFVGRLEDLGGSTFFYNNFCGMGEKGRNGEVTYEGSANESELNRTLRQMGYVRRESADVLKDMPPLRITDLTFEISNREEYQRVEDDLASWCAEQAVKKKDFLDRIKNLSPEAQEREKYLKAAMAAANAMKNEAIIKFGALRRVTGKGKIAPAIDWIKDFLPTGKKLVVFAEHQQVQHEIQAYFKCLHIFSADSTERRQRTCEIFQGERENDQEDFDQIIMCSQGAAKEGVTLTAAHHLLSIELPWCPTDEDQRNKRIHRHDTVKRHGQQPCLVYNALGDETVDDTMYRLLARKRKIVQAVTSGNPFEDANSVVFEMIDALAAKHAGKTFEIPEDAA